MNLRSYVQFLTMATSLCLLSLGPPSTVDAQSGAPRRQLIWGEAGTDATGSVSKDGRLLTFIDWSTGNLALRDLASGTNRPLTTNASFSESRYSGTGVVSPDQRRVAYEWLTASGVALYVLDLASKKVDVVDGEKDDTSSRLHGWTADGRELLIVRGRDFENVGEIGFLRVRDGQFRRVGRVGALARADLSRDGLWIAVSELSSTDSTRRDMRIINTRTRATHPLLTGADDYSPRWIPDGRGLVFLSDRESTPGLWYVSLDANRKAGTPRRLADVPDAMLNIVGVSDDGTVFIGAEDVGGQQAYVARADWATGAVTDVRELSTPPYTGARRAVFAPDGARVAYFRKRRGLVVRPGWQTPVVRSLSDGTERAYPTRLTLRDEPVWSSDGTALLFAMVPEGAVGESAGLVWDIVRLELSTGEYSVWAKAAAPGLVRLAGTVEGSLIYMLNSYGEKNIGRLMRVDIASGAALELHRVEGTTYNDAAVTPDGLRFALALAQTPEGSGVFVMTPPAPPKNIGTVRPNARAQLAWFPNAEAVLVSGRINNKPGIWRLPVAGGEPTQLRFDAGDVIEVRLSPDGERVAFTRRADRPRELWAYKQALPVR